METIGFNRNRDAYGWLSNMSQYPIQFGDKTWRTTEALFQALRFKDEVIQEAIRSEKSPMSAKAVMEANTKDLAIEKHSDKDVMNMLMCLKLKLQQHPQLVKELLETGDALIVEDVTARGDKGGNMFWGAMLVDGEWVGKNTLGKLWMDLRKDYQNS
jgi:hypothetical protein